MGAAAPKERFGALDGWRGIGAIVVVLLHIPIRNSFLGLPFFDGAYLFVDFFFVLSGFVIAHAYGSVLVENPSASWPFLIKRFGRLWPLHAAIFVLFLVPNLARLLLLHAFAAQGYASAGATGCLLVVVQQLTLLQALSPEPTGFITDGPSWSISAEFWTYVVFALSALVWRRRQLQLKFVIVLVSFAVVAGFSAKGMDVYNWLGFFRCFYGFFLGQLLYALYRSAPSVRFQAEWSVGVATALELATIALVVVFNSTVKFTDVGFAAPLLFTVVIYVFAVERGGISRLLLTGPFQKVGLYSYSIYLLHFLFISSVMGLLRVVERLAHVHLIQAKLYAGTAITGYFINFGGDGLMICFSLLIVACVVYAASWTYRLIELPGQAYFGQVARRQSARLAVARATRDGVQQDLATRRPTPG